MVCRLQLRFSELPISLTFMKKGSQRARLLQSNKLILGCTCTFDNKSRQNIRFKYSKCTILCTIFVFSWVFHCLYLSIMCFGLEGCSSTFNAKKIEYAYVLSSRRKRWMIIGKRVGEKDRRHHSIYISRFRIFLRLLVSRWREVYSFWGI